MNEEIKITIPIIPKAQMRARHFSKITKSGNIFTGTHKAAKQQRYEDQLMCLLAENMPTKPFSYAVVLNIIAFLPIPVSWPEWKRDAAKYHFILPVTKPDKDNLEKNIVDCMTKLSYWHDDSQVVDGRTKKLYSENPRWEITIREYKTPQTKKEYLEMRSKI